jgi:lipid II:glycine glycyltransferase (peptidoglycan interpeptide bridge formation enzyme)
MYGASRDLHREKMPNHLLQWEAMTWAKANSYRVYDMWGAPDDFVEGDPLWGVWRFKAGFGGQVVRHIGAWDRVISRPWHWLYTFILPRYLDAARWLNKIAPRSAPRDFHS